jgi:hypothetical protein
MRGIIFFFVWITSFLASANCELLSWRFHTEGVYKFPSKYEMRTYQTNMRDGGILFLKDIQEELKKNKFFEKINGTFGTINNISLEGAIVSTHDSVKGKVTFLKTKDELNALPSEPMALVNLKERSIITSGENYLPEKEMTFLDDKNIPVELLDTLKKRITNKNFKVVNDKVDYANGKALRWNSQKLGEKNWKLVQVLTRFPVQVKSKVSISHNNSKEAEISFIDVWIAFLTIDDKVFWYIGNSSGSQCGKSIIAEHTSVTPDGAAVIGQQLKPHYGHHINGKNDELIYSFGDKNIIYYLKFNELMAIFVEETYR